MWVYNICKYKTEGINYFQENAALCDEVAKIQESILIVKEERKFLLRKLLEYEHEPDNTSHTYCRNDTAVVLNGPRAKLKKRLSLEDGGKTSSALNV